MTDDHAWPQDWGTGLDDQVDWVDAAAVAHLMDHPNLRGCVADGMEFDVDYTNNILTITAGNAYLRETTTTTNDHREDDGPAPKTLEGGVFKVQNGVSGDISLVDNEINYVYLNLDQTNNEDDETTANPISYVTNTTATAPTEPYLRIGRVDTFAAEKFEENRSPVTESRRLRVTGYREGGS